MADVNPEQLLQDLAWLRGLATTLAHDRDDADDLVQEAWIAAWRQQPDATRPMRGWFTKVIRDLAGMKRRSDRRRAARHGLVTDERVVATPDNSLAQLRLHKLLVDRVLELEEPYRSTIIARFVEGRTSAEIAASLGIPAGTVRKRLHEALSRLRSALDADVGDRKRWAPAVLAFAQKGLLVAKPIKLGLLVLVALLLATAATVMVVRRTRDDSTVATTSTHSPARAASRAAPPADANVIASAIDARAPRGPSPEHAAKRAAMLGAIANARDARQHTGASATPRAPTTPTTPTSDPPGTTLDIIDRTGDTSDWSKRALVTLNRLMGQCYDLGLAEDSALAGNVTVHFTIVGEPDIGGLLEEVAIVEEETTISQPTIRDCLTEQLYALELDPPPAGVTVERQLMIKVP